MSSLENNKDADVLDRTKPPAPGKIRDVKFPDFFESKTENGITVLVVEDRKLPLVSVRFVFKAGAYYDTIEGKDKVGLASMMSDLISKGTSSRTATEIAEQVDFLGAVLSDGCDYDASYVSCYSLKKHFDNIFDIASDVVLDPTFPEEEIKRVKDQRLNSLLGYLDEGDYLASRVFHKYVYGNFPYAFPVEGMKETVSALTREDFINFHKKYFTSDNLIIAFVGDISPEEAMVKVNEKFRGMAPGEKPTLTASIPDPAKPSHAYLIEKKGSVQSSIKLGHLGISRDNPDFIKATVMNTILGGSFTSRINYNLREVNGYTYGAKSFFDWKKYSGDFSADAEVKNILTHDAVNEIIKEIRRIREELVSEDELSSIKNFITGNFPLQLETPNAIASKLINLKLYDIEDDYYNTYLSKVNAITREEIKETAEKYLHPDNLVISIAGNPKEIEDNMKQICEVSVLKEL
jgi:zinc protease